MTLTLDKHVYQPSHGPKIWPWWKLLVLRVVRCTHDPYRYFWITPITYNIWIYTRWGAGCATFHHRRGVYRRNEFGQLDGGES